VCIFVVAKMSVPIYEHTVTAYVGEKVGIHVFVTFTLCVK